jgi:thiazole/oxazole-forming peptide maturase SagD family component
MSSEEELLLAAARYRAALPMGRGYEFSLTPLDCIEQPLWAVGVWGDGHIFVDGFGYKATAAGAQVSALGEAAENYFASRWMRSAERREASYAELLREGTAAVDPVTLCLDAGCGYTAERRMTWVPAVRHPAGERVLVPIEAAAIGFNDISATAEREQWVMTPITNGLGAGLTMEQALVHGLLELVQRDGDSVSFRALDQGVAITLDAVENEGTRQLLRKLEEEDIEVIAKLAEVNCGMPVIYVVGHDRNIERPAFPLTLSACGEAADPDRERALEKALREYVSSRARKRFMHGPLEDVASVAPEEYMDRLFADAVEGDESRALECVLDWVRMPRAEFFELIRDPVLTVRSHVKFSELPTHEGGLDWIAEQLRHEGLEILYVDFTEPGSGVSAVKAIVPGLEVETISYGRIGARNLKRLMERGSPIVSIGPELEGARRILLTAEQESSVGGAAWLHPEELERAVGQLYGLYREPNGHSVARLLEGR